MTPPKTIQSYRQIATQTAAPGQLILMLYDGALQFLERALAGFEATDLLEFNQTINNNVLRAQAIVHELDYSLNMKAGGEFATNLRRLYHYLDQRLQESNLTKTQEGIRDVRQRLAVLRTAWAEMLTNQWQTQPQSGLPLETGLSRLG